MAVAYATKNEAQSTGAGSTLVITKPSALAAGDMLVAFLYGCRSVSDWATPSGWTKVGSSSSTAGSDANLTIVAKIADSSDAAATDFSFVPNASHEEKRGILVRVTGNFAGGSIANLVRSDFDSNVTDTGTGGLTPVHVDQLLFIAAATQGQVTTSGYSVSADNPTWTELSDGFVDTAVDLSYALATANRSSGAATGSYAAVNGAISALGIVSINEVVSASLTPAVISLSISVPAVSISGGANVSPTAITITLAVQVPEVSFPTPLWENEDKAAAPEWENQDKP